MGGEPKTLKQIEAAQSVLNDILEIIDNSSRGRRAHNDIEGRFRHAVNVIARSRLKEIDRILSDAWARAHQSSNEIAIVDRSAFDDIRWFRSIGPAKLSKLARGG
ncbi:hypothetical protein XH79_22625 [Bradyrhizobium sp. CCBAU 45389]|nr:hypothetical protein [Bradyrhizobium sp. CCBAU 45389]